MRGVPFLPEEFGRPEKRPRDLLPPDDVRPLIDQDGQVAPRLNPLRVQRADDHFGRRPDDERLGKLFIAAARHPRDLRRKAFDVFLLFHQQAGRDEEREVRVDVAGGLDPAIERLLDQFPDGIAVRPDRHAALDLGVIRQLCPADDIEIPLREVFRLGRDFGHGPFAVAFLHHSRWSASHRRAAPPSVRRRFQCRSSRSGCRAGSDRRGFLPVARPRAPRDAQPSAGSPCASRPPSATPVRRRRAQSAFAIRHPAAALPGRGHPRRETDRRSRHIRSRISATDNTRRGRHVVQPQTAQRHRLAYSRQPAHVSGSIASSPRRRIARPARAPNTRPSSSELLASRLAPWTPVHATSRPRRARASSSAHRDR